MVDFFASYNLPSDRPAALKEILKGVSQERLAKIEEKYPGTKSIAYKRLTQELLKSGVSLERQGVIQRMFPNILKDSRKIEKASKTYKGRAANSNFRKNYTSRASSFRASSFSHQPYFYDDRMSFTELYLWAEILHLDPLLVMATGDPLSAWLIEEIFEPNFAQESLQDIPQDQQDFSDYNPDVRYQEGDYQSITQEQFDDQNLEQFLAETDDPNITDAQFATDVMGTEDPFLGLDSLDSQLATDTDQLQETFDDPLADSATEESGFDSDIPTSEPSEETFDDPLDESSADVDETESHDS